MGRSSSSDWQQEPVCVMAGLGRETGREGGEDKTVKRNSRGGIARVENNAGFVTSYRRFHISGSHSCGTTKPELLGFL